MVVVVRRGEEEEEGWKSKTFHYLRARRGWRWRRKEEEERLINYLW